MARLLAPDYVAARTSAERTQREQDWANLGRYQQHNAEVAAQAAPPDLVFNSISELWPVADSSLFTPGGFGAALQARKQYRQ